jgi:hypothetical protein
MGNTSNTKSVSQGGEKKTPYTYVGFCSRGQRVAGVLLAIEEASEFYGRMCHLAMVCNGSKKIKFYMTDELERKLTPASIGDYIEITYLGETQISPLKHGQNIDEYSVKIVKTGDTDATGGQIE